MKVTHRNPGPALPDSLTPGALLRAAADGELSGAGQARLDDHLRREPGDACRIEFERRLRAACRSALAGDAAVVPESLRARVAVLASERAGEAAAQAGWLARRWRALAVAAAIVLGLSAVYLAFVREPAPISWPSGKPRLVGFVSREHRRCAATEAALRGKATVADLAATPAAFERLLGRPLTIPAIESAGFEFLGAGPCAVPGRGRSVHFMFRASRGSDPATAKPEECRVGERLSVFIQADTGDLPMEPGRTYSLESTAGGPGVLAWVEEGLIYYLVTDSPGAVEVSLSAMGKPAPAGRL